LLAVATTRLSITISGARKDEDANGRLLPEAQPDRLAVVGPLNTPSSGAP
jgi:hypothetical protein